MSKKSDADLNKKIDNEIKKKEMEKKYGASFGGSGDLPPEVESNWLRSIEEFEKQFEGAKRTTVYDFMGQPPFKKLDELQPAEVSDELKGLYDMLGRNNISLDTLREVADEELYRFITEELFEHEIDDMRVPGMMTCFTYEEFHPNAEYDIEMAYDYFFRFTLAKMENYGGEGYDMLYVDTERYEDTKGEVIPKKRVVDAINNFLASIDSFEIITNEIKSIEINDEETDAVVNFYIDYKGLFANSKETIDFKGNARFKLKPSEYGGWSIYHIDMPGLKI